jgi:hypothetical protein
MSISSRNPLAIFCGATVLVLLTAVNWAAAQDAEGVPRVAVPLMKHAPKIDGVIDEAEWREAVRSVDFINYGTDVATVRQGIFWLGCDGQTLYLAVKSEAPPDGRLLTRAVPDAMRDVRAVLHDDCLELVIDPKRGRAAGDRTFYHIITNARGALYDWSFDPDNRQSQVDLNWRLPAWQMRQTLADGWWNVEIAIPLASLGATSDDLKHPWGLQVARNWKRPSAQSQWSSQHADYDHQPAMPVVTWDPAAPVVQVARTPGSPPKIDVSLFNPHDRPVTVRAELSDTWHRDPPVQLRQDVTLAPNQATTLSLALREGGPEGLHTTSIRVSRGAQTCYERTWKWSLHRTKDAWAIADEQQQAVDLQFKYYPYADKIDFRVSLESLAVRDKVTGAQALLWRADGAGKPAGEPIWQRPIALASFVAESICDIPSLAAGVYLFGVRLSGADGVPREPVVQRFVRQIFPWEHNQLGISDEVMPPFTPLAVRANSVDAVLRQHRHGPSGLWESVAAQRQELLAAPMRWEVTASEPGGQPRAYDVQGQGWQATSHKATAVTGCAQWSAGPLRAKVSTQYDYDGMMLVTLDLEPTGAAAVHQLALAIPLSDQVARYMHAAGDGLRFNYAGFVPPGQGRIWDSSKASKLELPGTFYPYLWVGDGERGLCWFADTDRDWVLDDQTPAVDLTRRDGALTLRVHFITRPGSLRRAHRIVFGLQATPTKPMPDGWRRWVALRQVEGGRTVRWLGHCYYWGGLAYDVYPYRYGFEFYDKLAEARRTGQSDRDFIARWIAMLQKDLAPKGSQRDEFLRRHVNAGFSSTQMAPWSGGTRLFGYTNPRGAGFHVPEFATFQDEWLRYRWFNRNWSPTDQVGYDVDPCRSFQDYALWYYRKMLTCFDGVYWDNLFLSANFDPVAGQAWSDAQGKVHPTLGLLSMRELCKRTAIMMWQESRAMPAGRRPPITLAHMTNTMIVPVLSFINCTMDWEWKYGMDDFQDRFSPDLIVAESVGRQVGARPTVLSGGFTNLKDPRLDRIYRTRLGVTLVHEIQVFDSNPKRDTELYRKLFQFGYGDPATRVFNYWQPGHPVKVDGTRTCTLAMANPSGAIVVVTDYAAGGNCRVTLDLARLGLGPQAAAVDLESGLAVDRLAPGVFSFSIPKHDFRILRVK